MLPSDVFLSSGGSFWDRKLSSFEQEYAQYCGAKYCASVGNGLDALTISLQAAGVGVGDEVIVPSNTFIATWLAVSRIGAVPVPVEPDEKTHNVVPALIEQAITPRTRAIIPVHLYGQPADLDQILEIAKRYNLVVVEDAAQAHGARYKGVRIGAHSDLVSWSFYPGKNLGAFGDGGAITTNDQTLFQKIKLLRNYGSSEKYVHEVQGCNSRLDALQASILRVKLKHLDDWNARRKRIATKYMKALVSSSVTLPTIPEWAECSWHLFVIASDERNRLRDWLQSQGVSVLIHYPTPPHLQEAYAHQMGQLRSLPISSNLAERILSLPISPHLDDESVNQVIEAVLAFKPR